MTFLLNKIEIYRPVKCNTHKCEIPHAAKSLVLIISKALHSRQGRFQYFWLRKNLLKPIRIRCMDITLKKLSPK